MSKKLIVFTLILTLMLTTSVTVFADSRTENTVLLTPTTFTEQDNEKAVLNSALDGAVDGL